MSTGNDSILDAYLFETNSLLEQLDSIVLAAEQQDTFSDDDINSIFRIMHTIKGSSAMMEYNSLMTIAHRAEDLFAIIREQSIAIVPESLRPNLFDLLFQTIDFFRQEIDHIENGQSLTDDIDTLLQKINSFITQIQGGGDEAQADASSAAPSASGAFPYGLQIFFDEGCGMENLRAFMLVTSIKDICAEEEFSYYPADVEHDASTAAQIIESGFRLSFAKASDRDNAIHVATDMGFVRTYQVIDESPETEAEAQPAPKPAPQPEAAVQSAPPAQPEPQPEPVKAASPAPAPAAPSASKAENTVHHKESLISVNLSKLDTLAAVVGEIVIMGYGNNLDSL